MIRVTILPKTQRSISSHEASVLPNPPSIIRPCSKELVNKMERYLCKPEEVKVHLQIVGRPDVEEVKEDITPIDVRQS